MIKLLIIIPYQDLAGNISKMLESFDTDGLDVQTTHFYGTKERDYKNLVADVLVARGITSKAIAKGRPDIHVVDIPISSSDLISALHETKHRFGLVHVGIMVADTGICNPDELEDLIGMPISVKRIETDSDVELAIDNLVAEGCQVLIGGLTVCRACERKGCACVHIRTGEAAVEQSVREAVTVARSLNRERVRVNLLSTVLNSTKDPMLAIGADGIVFASNSQAVGLFNKEIEGLKLESFLPGLQWRPVLENGMELQRICSVEATQMLVTQVPIMLETDAIGVLFTLQNIEAIRLTEQKIRTEMHKKGLVAKYHFGDILCKNEVMKDLISRAVRFAQVDSNILIVGETGTGKELFAQSLHNASRRSSNPFVAVNCAALPEQLLESELFGYTDGAFTGAVKGGKAGLFELAHTGSIFLDEIGEMPLRLQAKILRVLQEKEIRKVGGDNVVPVDVRIICATNSNLRSLIEKGQFREDLYYRINLLNLSIPPLRKRREDIEVIFQHFINHYAKQMDREKPEFEESAIKMIESYDWPGNIRELRNFAEQTVVLYWGSRIGEKELLTLIPGDERVEGEVAAVRKMSNSELKSAFERSGMSAGDFARQQGMSRTTLWRRLSQA